MIPVLSHNVPIGDTLSHGKCGNTFHYLAFRWSLDHLEGDKAVLAEKPIPVMVCPKCHLHNDSPAAIMVARLIADELRKATSPPG